MSVGYEKDRVVLCLHAAFNRQFPTSGFFMLKSVEQTAEKLARIDFVSR
jgi:hypothetical protein